MKDIKIGDSITVAGIVKAITEEQTGKGIIQTVTITFPEAESWSRAIVIQSKHL